MGSCVLKASTVKCWSIPAISTWLALSRHLIACLQKLVDSRLTVDRVLIKCHLSYQSRVSIDTWGRDACCTHDWISVQQKLTLLRLNPVSGSLYSNWRFGNLEQEINPVIYSERYYVLPCYSNWILLIKNTVSTYFASRVSTFVLRAETSASSSLLKQ